MLAGARDAASVSDASSVTSAIAAVTPGIAPSTSSSAALRTVAKTSQPSAAYWRASSLPMPRLAPTTTTLGMAFLPPAAALSR